MEKLRVRELRAQCLKVAEQALGLSIQDHFSVLKLAVHHDVFELKDCSSTSPDAPDSQSAVGSNPCCVW